MEERDRTILLVEDDEELRAVVARALRARGHRLEEAGSMEAAAAALEAGARPGLIVLDLNLPGDTGWDLLRGSAYADAGRPPVLVTSALTVRRSQLDAFGVAGYLSKPFPMETFICVVERLLSGEPIREIV
jgi:DNA-binding response OmpR family regulator